MDKVLFEMHVFYSQNVEFKGPNMAEAKGRAQEQSRCKTAPGYSYYISMIIAGAACSRLMPYVLAPLLGPLRGDIASPLALQAVVAELRPFLLKRCVFPTLRLSSR